MKTLLLSQTNKKEHKENKSKFSDKFLFDQEPTAIRQTTLSNGN